MADVFISYKNFPNRRVLAQRMAFLLEAYGISVWWDPKIGAGERYRERINRELADARIVVALWCEASVRSRFVRIETELGKDKLHPARLQVVSPPREFESINAAHLEGWDGALQDPRFEAFLTSIFVRLGRVRREPSTRDELLRLPRLAPLPPARRLAWVPVATAVTAAGLAAFVAISLLSPPSPPEDEPLVVVVESVATQNVFEAIKRRSDKGGWFEIALDDGSDGKFESAYDQLCAGKVGIVVVDWPGLLEEDYFACENRDSFELKRYELTTGLAFSLYADLTRTNGGARIRLVHAHLVAELDKLERK